jgi:3-dehydroquinate dehydratase/shikimate dehydrogenase
MICVAIVANTNEAARKQLRRAAAVADMAELRLDYIQERPDVGYLLADRPCPVIVTNRPPRQGGLFGGSEAERVAFLREAVSLGAEYVDIEYDSIGRLQEKLGTRVIVSYHNFEETPGDLHRMAQMLVGTGGDIIKIATYVNDTSDCIRLCQLSSDLGVPKIILGMGPRGLVTRVLANKFGSMLTYASLSGEAASAPGQLTVGELRDVYHYRKIDKATAIYGVVGTPLRHSLSPHVQNAAFRREGMNCVYVPFEADDFDAFIKATRCMHPQGLSVTIPHKEAAARAVSEVDAITAKIGAVNTIAIREGKMTGTNTDWKAAVDSIRAALPGDKNLAGRRALVLGAGGAARAIVFGLMVEGVQVRIANRTRERAEALAREAGCAAVDWDERERVECDIIANSTSLGMYPAVEATPFPKSGFRAGQVVFDAVYNPRQTKLLTEAAEADCVGVEGLEMFVRQAAAQFEFWTGRKAPIELMRETAIAAFNGMKGPE